MNRLSAFLLRLSLAAALGLSHAERRSYLELLLESIQEAKQPRPLPQDRVSG